VDTVIKSLTRGEDILTDVFSIVLYSHEWVFINDDNTGQVFFVLNLLRLHKGGESLVQDWSVVTELVKMRLDGGSASKTIGRQIM
jgi:hypothetical protein